MALVFRLTFLALLAAVASAAHSAPAPGADCSSLVMNMADCLSYVSVGGAAKKPEGTCCSGLKTVLKADPNCLCEAFKNSAQLGVTLNMTKAMTLPTACHASAPPLSNCAAVSHGPSSAPAPSPFALSPSSIAGAPSAITGASEAAPEPAPGNSGSSPLAVSIASLVSIMIIAASVALF